MMLVTSFSILAGCAVEVGNPHPDRDSGKKASIDVSILSEENLSFDRIGLNITGFGFISQEQADNNVSFSVRESIVLAKNDPKEAQSILSSTTTAQGNFDTIRINFSRRGVGEIQNGTQIFPIQLEAGRTYLDVPLKFQLTPGQKTNVTLGFNSKNLLEEFRDSEGQLISYTFKSEFGTEVASETITESAPETNREENIVRARSYRLTVLEVNAERQVFIRNLRLSMNDEWQNNDFSSSSGRIGVNAVTVQESSTQRSNYGWKALKDDTWKSANSSFDSATRRALAPEGEYIQFDFAQPVIIDGIEFRGDGGDNCANLYQVERLNALDQWEAIPGSVSEMEACSLVNITW